MPGVHQELRRQFARQAEDFERPQWSFGDEGLLRWVADATPIGGEDRVLDAAGGTGALGRFLSRHARACVILDVVPEMLEAGERAAADEGRRDVLFVRGDAADMPFLAGQFDVVVTRFALHHMEDPAAALREMARVCRPGGWMTVVDLVDGGGDHNRLERLRDPSHTRALARGELEEAVAAAGVAVSERREREAAMPVRPWFAQARTEEAAAREVEAALRAELEGGPSTGLCPREREGTLTLTQTWVLLGGRTSGDR
jgi:ubiquinone/menaquinone biosynthesis C-methylase UbiE